MQNWTCSIGRHVLNQTVMAHKKPSELLNELAQFTGTSQWYRNPLFKNFLYTDGVQHLAENAGAYWLIDYIFSNQIIPEIKRQEFQVWIITVEDSKAEIRVEDGNDNVIKEFKIPFTDFPLPEFRLWFSENVLLLPSEY